jgi:GT2 family glycosyltransferase
MSHAQTDISIIIITFNSAQFAVRCLSSVFGHETQRSREVIVLDNASEDGTAKLIRAQFPDAIVICGTENAGYGSGVNQAVRYATGRYFMFLNPDAELTPGAIDQLVQVLEADSRIGIIGPRLVFMDGSVQASARRFPSARRLWAEVLRVHLLLPRRLRSKWLLGTYSDQDESGFVDWISGACHVLSRQTWEIVGELTEQTFCGFDDLEYCMRARSRGLRTFFCSSAVVNHEGSAMVGQRWTTSDLATVAINNLYVVLHQHWPRWRIKLYAAAELFGSLTDLFHRSGRLTGDRSSYIKVTLNRIRVITGILTGIRQPIERCEP